MAATIDYHLYRICQSVYNTSENKKKTPNDFIMETIDWELINWQFNKVMVQTNMYFQLIFRLFPWLHVVRNVIKLFADILQTNPLTD